MTRAQAQENVSTAVADAYRAGCTPQQVQDGVEFGCRDGGNLKQAELARAGRLVVERPR